MLRLRAIAALLLTAVSGLWGRGDAQQTIRENPPLVIDSLYGPDVFAFYCAPCHGRDGKGSGTGRDRAQDPTARPHADRQTQRRHLPDASCGGLRDKWRREIRFRPRDG